jgi:hypothetical protein
MHSWRRLTRRRLAAILPLALALSLASVGTASAQEQAETLPSGPLRLGPAGLPETRTETNLAPGLTLTTIVRGRVDPANEYWTIGINIPIGTVPPNPDPDADQGALGTLANAQGVAAQLVANPSVATQLKAHGWQPRVEPVDWAPHLPGYPGGLIGYTVRVGRYPTAPNAADPVLKTINAVGFKAFTVYTGQDGRPDNTGPWVIRVLTEDPRRFKGHIDTTVGHWVSGRETTSAMAQEVGAVYAVNGGFFTISPADGTPGVPAGLSVLDGKILTAATNGRYSVVFDHSGRRARIAQLSSRFTIRLANAEYPVDGLNRPPGLIRNCGGVGGDSPTQRPVQDFTCTDPDELVVLTPQYGTTSPAGPGIEAVISPDGLVTEVRARTGAPVPPGDSVVQATGSDSSWLAVHATVGASMHLDLEVVDAAGHPVRFGPDDSVISAGPVLVEDGRVAVNPDADGLVHEDPSLNLPPSALGASFGYGWLVRDNPRTAVGVDTRGRVLIVEVDGRQDTYSQGLPVVALAELLRSLGAVEAINLDGGGSSAAIVNGRLVSSPSDTDSNGRHIERPVGDALVVTQAGQSK